MVSLPKEMMLQSHKKMMITQSKLLQQVWHVASVGQDALFTADVFFFFFPFLSLFSLSPSFCSDQGQCQANIQLIKDHTLPQIPKAAAVNTITESTSQEGWKRTSEVGAEALERDTSEDQEDLDEYIPDLAEFMNFDSSSPSSNESEYVTDEEMGEVKTKKKKKMKLRELSSEGDLSSSDEDRRKKRGIGKMKRMPSRYSDDGDRDHYLIRIQ